METILKCIVCDATLKTSRQRKYCSEECKRKSKQHMHTCRVCDVKFMGTLRQKVCSLKCVGDEQKDRLVEGNISRRKYENIYGLTKNQIFRLNNPDKSEQEYKRDNLKRIAVIMHLGGKCVMCGYDSDMRALQLDHTWGDGYLDRKKRGTRLGRFYINNLDIAKDILQVLCANCNRIKQISNKEFALSTRKKK